MYFQIYLASCWYCDEKWLKKKTDTRTMTKVMKKEFLTTRQTSSALYVEQCLPPTKIEDTPWKRSPWRTPWYYNWRREEQSNKSRKLRGKTNPSYLDRNIVRGIIKSWYPSLKDLIAWKYWIGFRALYYSVYFLCVFLQIREGYWVYLKLIISGPRGTRQKKLQNLDSMHW